MTRSGAMLLLSARRAGARPRYSQPAGAADTAAAQRIVSLDPGGHRDDLRDGRRRAGRRRSAATITSPPRSPGCRRSAACSIPSVERILAIKPDLVIVYATQKELIERLDRAGIPYFNYQHKALPDILTTIRALGARIGSAAPRRRARRRRWSDRSPRFAAKTAGLRAPGDAAGVRARSGVAAQRLRQRRLRVSPRHARDRRRPQRVRRHQAAGGAGQHRDADREQAGGDRRAALRRQPEERRHRQGAARLGRAGSIPAVRAHRISALTGDEFVVPGPRVVDATRKLARAIHPEAFR